MMKQEGKTAMELLEQYRGWTIERNPHGLIIAGRPDAGGFPFVAKDVGHAKQIIDARTTDAEREQWRPLVDAVGESVADQFMLMGCARTREGAYVFLYKHRDTRRYLNLDARGRAYVFDSRDVWDDPTGKLHPKYTPTDKAAAIRNALR